MQIRVVCQNCKKRYRVDGSATGGFLKCKKCGVFIEISGPAIDEQSPEVPVRWPTVGPSRVQQATAFPAGQTPQMPTAPDANNPVPNLNTPVPNVNTPTTGATANPAAVQPSAPIPTFGKSQHHLPFGNTAKQSAESKFKTTNLIFAIAGVLLLLVAAIIILLPKLNPDGFTSSKSSNLVSTVGLMIGLLGTASIFFALYFSKIARVAAGVVCACSVFALFFSTISFDRISVEDASQPAAMVRSDAFDKNRSVDASDVTQPLPVRKSEAIRFNPDEPFTYSDESKTNHQLNEERVKFYSLAIDHYLETTKDSSTRKQWVSDFARKVFENRFPPHGEAPHLWSALYTQSQELLPDDLLQADPLLLVQASTAASYVGNYDDAVSLIDRAIKRFRKTEYPQRIIAYAYVWYETLITQRDWASGGFGKIREASETFSYWLQNDFRATPEEHQFVYELIDMHIDNIGPIKYDIADMSSQLWTSKFVPPWLQAMVRAKYHFATGWKARGHDFAGTVTQQGWADFQKHLREAAKWAKEAYRINPKFAAAPCLLTGIAAVGHEDESRESWFRRTQESQFDYLEVYSIMRNFMLPQWGGSVEELIEHGEACYDSQRFDTRVPFELIHALATIKYQYEDRSYTPNSVFRNDELYKKVRDCLTKYAEWNDKYKTKEPDATDYYRTLRALMSYQFGYVNQAVEDLLELQERMDYKAVAFLGASFSPRYFRSKWYMLEHENREFGRELAGMFYSPDSREQRKQNAAKIRELIERGLENNMDPVEQDFFRLYERMFKYENDYDDGKWVNLEFHDGLIDWRCTDFSICTVESPTSLVIDTRLASGARFYLSPFANFPGPKTIEVEFEILDPTPKLSTFCPGIQVMAPGYGGNSAFASVNRFPRTMYFGPVNQGATRLAITSYDMDTINQKVRLNADKGYFEFFNNDYYMSSVFMEAFECGQQVRIGQFWGYTGRGRVRIKNLRLRQWMAGKPPEVLDYSEDFFLDGEIDYYTMAQDDYENQPYYQYRMALAYFNAGRYDRAARHALAGSKMGNPTMDLFGFFIGYDLDRQGKYLEATKHYKLCSESLATIGILQNNGFDNANTPENFARSYKSWLIATAPESQRAEFDALGTPGFGRHPIDWVSSRIGAASYAYEGKWEQAIRSLEFYLDKNVIPEEFLEEYEKQLSDYRAKRRYVRDVTKPPFYHNLRIYVEPRMRKPLKKNDEQEESVN